MEGRRQDSHTAFQQQLSGLQNRPAPEVWNKEWKQKLDAKENEMKQVKEEIISASGNPRSVWCFEGHKDRIIQVTEKELALFAQLYDDEGTEPLAARLPALHAQQLLAVLEKFAAQPQRLGDLQGEYFSTQHWNESNAQDDGTIRRETSFPADASQWVLSGPHFFVGNPFYNTPREVCSSNKAYDSIDLLTIPDDYLPRTNYLPDCSPDEYRARTPKVSWVEQGETQPKRVTEYYRFVNRRMFGSSSERSFIGAIVPKEVGHINTAVSTSFASTEILTNFTAATYSVVFDFYLKTT